MNRVKILLLLISCGMVSFAQTAGEFKNFSSWEGGYVLQLPARAELSAAGPLTPEATGMGEGYFNRWSDRGVLFEAGYIKFREQKTQPTAKDIDANLDAAVMDVLGMEAVNGVEPAANKPLMTDGRGWQKARELTFEANAKVSLYRVFAGDGVIVRLRAVAQKDAAQMQMAYRFLSSLKMVSRDEIFAEKIREATPAELPQQRPAEWMKPDVDGIAKGKVSFIYEEVENTKAEAGAPNMMAVPGRHKKVEHHFDPQGFLTKTVSYDHTGFPVMVSVYGFIDGMRVSKSGDVENERVFSGPLPVAPIAGSTVPKKRDERYAVRVAEKYDADKRLSERIFYDNAGDQFLRAIYSYRENRIEISEYRRNGAPDNNVSQVLDQNGNVIQKTVTYLGKDPSERRYVYKYLSFDDKGNWTKRTVAYEVKKEGKIIYTSEYTESRSIMYW